MAAFLNVCRFTPTAGSTTDWTYSAAVTGYQSPTAAGVVNGTVYKYRAESSDLSQWEIGEGAYNTGTGVLARTTVLYNSSGSGTGTGQSGAGSKISFSAAPQVAIVAVKEDLLSVTEANAFTAAQKLQAATNIEAVSYGTSAQSLTSAQKAQARANIDALKKNYIFNGAMMVSQENGTAAGTTTGYYPVDIFHVVFVNGGATSTAQVASTSPAGSPNRLRVTATTADASVASGDYSYIEHHIEGLNSSDLLLGSASAKTFTIQFGVKAPEGTYCVAILNSAKNRSYVAEYTITSGEANTSVVKSVTIAGDTSGTWLATAGGTGITIRWGLMAGSTYQQAAGSWSTGNIVGSSNQFNLMGTINNVFELFDVSLTEGSDAPDFVTPDYDGTLRSCQRYYSRGYHRMQFAGISGENFLFAIMLPREMCVAPTITYNTTSYTNASGLGTTTTDTRIFTPYANASATATVGVATNWFANSRLT